MGGRVGGSLCVCVCVCVCLIACLLACFFRLSSACMRVHAHRSCKSRIASVYVASWTSQYMYHMMKIFFCQVDELCSFCVVCHRFSLMFYRAQ